MGASLMRIDRDELESVVYGARGGGRFTQDSPVMPDVWFGYGADPSARLDLLIEPYRGVGPGEVCRALRDRLDDSKLGGRHGGDARLAYDESYVVVALTLEEMVRFVLPLTRWWERHAADAAKLNATRVRARLESAESVAPGATTSGVWFLRVVGTILWARDRKGNGEIRKLPSPLQIARTVAPLLAAVVDAPVPRPLIWSVNRNRPATVAMWDSRRTVKADAANQIFGLNTSHLAWAILDTGVDAKHPAFLKRDADGRLCDPGDEFSSTTRVNASYDFTKVRDLSRQDDDGKLDGAGGIAEFRRRLLSGRAIDWEQIDALLRIPHDAGYVAPIHPHGTHVAGILGGDWRRSDAGYDADGEYDMLGLCPQIQLYDLRVLDANGGGDEFSVLAALQFIRYLNSRSHQPIIQGVNLSISIPHDVSNYACGRTPVCNEVERLHASGVLIVAAAGNDGYVQYLTRKGESNAYRNISITDPGNAESILTVGATHRSRPHSYGVSYFSSRGPTGDGRVKPDLVAPGEKIKGPAPGRSYARLDGTSMAAPHISGAAALLMSRHPEFIGDPKRVKEILCRTATDLGRERYFQGAGLVDVCRAIQSV